MMLRTLWTLLTIAAFIGAIYSAAQLYRVKGETRAAIRETTRLSAQAHRLKAEIAALDVEWAYLNGPENLNRLVAHYSDELQLKERVPDSFARLSELPFRGSGASEDEAENQ